MNDMTESEKTAFKQLQQELLEVLPNLDPREQEVLRMRFGLEDGESLTAEQSKQNNHIL